MGGRVTNISAAKLLVAGFTVAAVAATVCPAQPIRELDTPNPRSQPQRIIAASDGALWFTESLGRKIGRVTTDGQFQEFAIPSGGNCFDITEGPDRAIWCTEFYGSRLGRVSLDGKVTEYPLPGNPYPTNVTAGPDGAVWFTDVGNRIGRMTLAGVTTYFSTADGPLPCVQPLALLFHDADLWFTCEFHTFGRLKPTGELTVFRNDPNWFPGA